MGCNCHDRIKSRRATPERLVAFTTSVRGDEAQWYRHDAVFCSDRPPEGLTRMGTATVVCACEQSWTRLGGGAAVVYGKNGKRLWEAYQEVQAAAVVIVALWPGTSTTGRAVAQIRTAAGEAGRHVRVVRFEDRQSVRVHAQEDPPTRIVRRG